MLTEVHMESSTTMGACLPLALDSEGLQASLSTAGDPTECSAWRKVDYSLGALQLTKCVKLYATSSFRMSPRDAPPILTPCINLYR